MMMERGKAAGAGPAHVLPRESGRMPAHPLRILLTGRPGAGKTTVILRTLERLDRPAAGFYTQEVREAGPRGARLGFDVITLDGARAPLARTGFRGPRVGRYGVDVRGFEELAIPALERGLADPGTLLVLDELGKMEFLSRAFVAFLPRVFAAPNPLLGTIMSRPHPVADRWRHAPGVEIVAVTAANRERLPDALARRFG
jgi:nucleoside-triphosphatase